MSPIKSQPFLLQKMFRLALMATVLLGAVGYFGWQARYLIIGPEVALTGGLETVQNERVITLSGEAKNVTALYLNGRAITTDQAGVFTESIVLQNGYSTVSIDAIDRYGRRVHIETPMVYSERTEVVKTQLVPSALADATGR